MKYCVFLFLIVVTAFAWVDNDGRDSSIPFETVPTGNDAIILGVVNTFQVASAGQMLGLDTQGPNQISLVDNSAGLVRAVQTGTGNPVWTIANPGCYLWGCCHSMPAPYGWYANSFANSNMHYYSGSWSIAFADPAGQNSRGMDYWNDQNYIWETCSSGSDHRLYRIDGSGNSIWFDVSSTIPGQMSGLAVFPYGSNLGIFVTCYDSQEWFLYEYTGSYITYKGSGDPGMTSFTKSYGLTYNPEIDKFYWSYVVYGTLRWIAEVEFSETSLEQATWGSIKTQF